MECRKLTSAINCIDGTKLQICSLDYVESVVSQNSLKCLGYLAWWSVMSFVIFWLMTSAAFAQTTEQHYWQNSRAEFAIDQYWRRVLVVPHPTRANMECVIMIGWESIDCYKIREAE